ncbi:MULTISPECIES: pyruvate kinase [Clostridia]|uniref:pyruvate kinase n=1 Tax=Clostridia TaxID=186801 RepID=UPI0013149E42|nr:MULTISPECIES: pyruvate kinase [Clostridia]
MYRLIAFLFTNRCEKEGKRSLYSKEIINLYNKIITIQDSFPKIYPTLHQQFSAENLLAFMELKNNIKQAMMHYLKEKGLHLAYIDYIIKGLFNTCQNLNNGRLTLSTPSTELYTQAIRRKHSTFHTNQNLSPEIMVTLDISLISAPTVIREFLLNGMTIARINCAYGDQNDWLNLIKTVRQVERDLACSGINLPKCKIYMDLAGPKIRVGPIQKITYPFKIKIKKDRFGRPLHVKKGLLQHSKIPDDERTESYDFILPIHVDKGELPCRIGEPLQFLDAQQKKRSFKIVGIKKYGYVVIIEETSYVLEGSKITHSPSKKKCFVGELEKSVADIYVKKGDQLKINLLPGSQGIPASTNQQAEIAISHPTVFSNVTYGDNIYIDDGKIHGIVTEIYETYIIMDVLAPKESRKINENKGVNLPDATIRLPSLTPKDLQDLEFVQSHADMVGLSFVHYPEDLKKLRLLIPEEKKASLTIVAKIETKAAVNHFSNILLEGLHFPKFAVMLARGDLAIEVGFEKLSLIQQEMLSMCQAAHVPIILATQVLDSLAKKGFHSRAELADIILGSSFDCIMLNKGSYVAEAVDFLNETLRFIVKKHQYNQMIVRKQNVNQ